MYWVKVKYLDNYSPEWPPLEKKEGDMCFDLRAATQGHEAIRTGEIKKIPLGVVLEPTSNCGIKIYPRSGWASRGLALANSVGIIDSDYRGEVAALVINRNPQGWLVIQPGDRIVQGEVVPIREVIFQQAAELSETLRGGGGFGSTG